MRVYNRAQGKMSLGKKKILYPIQSDSKKKKLTAGKEERIITQWSSLMATWDQSQRYILPSIPPPLSQWIKNTRDGYSKTRNLFSTQYIIHAMKQQLPSGDFQLTILKKVNLFSLETRYGSTSTNSPVFRLLTTKDNDGLSVNKLTVPGLYETHICSIFCLVCFVFMSSSEDLPIPQKPTNAKRFQSRVSRAFLLWFQHLMLSRS